MPMSHDDIQKLVLYFAISYAVISVSNTLWVERSRLNNVLHAYIAGWRDYLHALFIVFITINTLYLLWTITPDFLHFGWLSIALDSGGSMFSVTAATAQKQTGQQLWSAVGLTGFYILLLLALPMLAKREEKMFRAGRHSTPQVLYKSIQFGLAHLIVGIPVFAALGLIVTGLLFARVYLKSYRSLVGRYFESEAIAMSVERSAKIHTLYNFILVNVVFIPVIVVLFRG